MAKYFREAGSSPERLAAAAIAARGVNEVSGFPAPSFEDAAKIRSPFLILHGSKDALGKYKVVFEGSAIVSRRRRAAR